MGKAKKRRSGVGKRTDPVGKNFRIIFKWIGGISGREGGGGARCNLVFRC
jgi:hypothetical protein